MLRYLAMTIEKPCHDRTIVILRVAKVTLRLLRYLALDSWHKIIRKFLFYKSKILYYTVTYNNTKVGFTEVDRSIEFVVDDGGAHSNTSVVATTTLTLNSPPTAVNLNNTTTTLPENTNTTNRIKVADIVITDDGLGTNIS